MPVNEGDMPNGYKCARLMELYKLRYAKSAMKPILFRVSGVTFDNRSLAIERLQVGDRVHLVPEPSNRFDRHAIQVLAEDGQELGYVPRASQERVLPMLHTATASVFEVGQFQTEQGVKPFLKLIVHF